MGGGGEGTGLFLFFIFVFQGFSEEGSEGGLWGALDLIHSIELHTKETVNHPFSKIAQSPSLKLVNPACHTHKA